MVYADPPEAKKNSVSTVTTADLLVGSTAIPVADLSVFHKGGVLIPTGICLGTDSETESRTEEITVAAASATSGAGNLTGATRGVGADGTIGAAYAWPAGTKVCVVFSTGTYQLIKASILALKAALSYGYVGLTVLQATVPDNNPATLGQGPELGNGVNFAWAEFSHSAAARLQWIVAMPADWDGGTITAIIGWTATASAGGTVKWSLKGYRVGDNATLNATLGALGSVTDTFLTANYLHVTAESSALTIGGTGNLLLLELIRDYANDTDTDPARVISLRLKYGRTV